MIKNFVEVGTIVGTHGLNGELRVQPWADSPDELKKYKKFYLKESETDVAVVSSCRIHGNIVILKLKDIDNIDNAIKFKNRTLYVKRSDIKLQKGHYLIDEIKGCKVFGDVEESVFYGVISDVTTFGSRNDVWHIKNDDKEYLFPAVKSMIISVEPEKERVIINPIKGIFDD